MIKIIIFSLISNLLFYSYGHLIKFEKFSNKIDSINNRSIIGCILVSFIALVANFFVPLDKTFNTLLLILGFLILFILKKKELKKKRIILYFNLVNNYIFTANI